MTYYENKLSAAVLTYQFVELGKTSRQISREFLISRKIVNKMLLNLNLITAKDLQPGDLP